MNRLRTSEIKGSEKSLSLWCFVSSHLYPFKTLSVKTACIYFLFPIFLFPLRVFESEIRSVMSDSLWPHGLFSPWSSPGQNTGVDICSLLQRLFPTQELNPGLPHCRQILFSFFSCRQILYQLSHKGSPRILEWVAYPSSIGPSRFRNQTRVSCIAGGFFSNWATRKAWRFFEGLPKCLVSPPIEPGDGAVADGFAFLWCAYEQAI